MTLGERIKELRKAAHLTQKDIADQLGMGSSNFGHIENNRVTPSSSDLDIIADILNTSVDYLLGKTNKREKWSQEIICSVCGQEYFSPLEDALHQKFHDKFLKAKQKYGHVIKIYDTEKIKEKSNSIIYTPETSTIDKIQAYEDYLEALYSQQLFNSNYSLDFPHFGIFVSQYLQDHQFHESLENVHEALTKKYGTLPGMKSSHNIELTENEILTLAAHKFGPAGEPSEDDLSKIKLAIKIALAKDNK